MKEKNDHKEKVMTNNTQQALVCALATQLIDAGSLCGEAHLQKAAYVAKHWLKVSGFEDFEFILYMYGPFSFDLKGELRAMRAEGWFKSDSPPTLRPTERVDNLTEQVKNLLNACAHEFNFIAEEFRGKDAAELERLTTALLATEKLSRKASMSERVRQLLQTWKLHFTEMEALRAVRDADEMLKRMDKLKQAKKFA